MADNSSVKFTIYFNDPELNADEQDEEAQWLMDELSEMEEVDTVERVRDPNPSEQGGKGLEEFLPGWLTVEANTANAKKLMGFLGDRLRGKPIELTVEVNGKKKKLSVKAHSREELEFAIKAAQDFIAQ